MHPHPLRAVAVVTAALLLAPWAHTAQGASGEDPLRARQWGLDLVRAPEAWKLSTGRGVLVAVADSGADPSHPDLRGSVLPGKNMLTGRPGATEGCGHGTQVSGVIAARRGNGIGVAGVAPSARVLPLKIGDCIDVDGNAVITAIRYAVAQGAKVINLSHATLPVAGQASAAVGIQDELQKAVDEAWVKGVLVVGSAGNFTVPLCTYPGIARHALCVGAVDRTGTRAHYSEGSNLLTDGFLVAPGGGATLDEDDGIWTTTLSTPSSSTDVGTGEGPQFPGYEQVQGTSFAAPYVSGVAALLFSRGYKVAEVRRRLLATARDLGPAGPDPLYGAGLLDAAAALAAR